MVQVISPGEFARLTIEANDLDPTYVGMVCSGLPERTLLRVCTGMLAFYHMGVACRLAEYEGQEYWKRMLQWYPTAPRSAERRHFRGNAGLIAVQEWAQAGEPEQWISKLMKPSWATLLKDTTRQIGTYFKWKVADYREAVFGYPFDWEGAHLHMMGLPKDGLEVMYPGEKPEESIWKMVGEIEAHHAPPRYNRPCGLAEAETIACMAKSYYLRGKPIGADIAEKRANLEGYTGIAEDILRKMPETPEAAKGWVK